MRVNYRTAALPSQVLSKIDRTKVRLTEEEGKMRIVRIQIVVRREGDT